MTRGYWCVHCERAWHEAAVFRRDGCPDPSCDGGLWDMWRIEGVFAHGEFVATASDRLAELQVFSPDVFEDE